ncbi:MAG: haloacid dehalogenase-like hydrolase [Clostridia bacterium]|nr:haloacid dehalogenase-like hydrolase [Clostridia bacterium]
MIYINNQEKINRLNLAENPFYVVADFDQTLTEGTSDSTWEVVASSSEIGEEYTRRRKEYYNYYRPMEIDPNLSEVEKSKAMDEWWKKHINLFYEYNMKEESMINSLNKCGLKYRLGAKDFINKMHKKNIPVIIISAGIGNVIENFFKRENDLYDNMKIISNFIHFENGVIKKMNDATIHSLNKNIVSMDKDLKESLKDKKILLLGDGLGDLKMIGESDKENTITVGFLEEKIEENLELFNKSFDIVITNEGSFEEVNNILKIY